jgi:hypothetical protein
VPSYLGGIWREKTEVTVQPSDVIKTFTGATKGAMRLAGTNKPSLVLSHPRENRIMLYQFT